MTTATARDVLERYQHAMKNFSADELADLYAADAVHEFPFLTPGQPSRYNGREAVRAAYRTMWAARRVALDAIENVAIHESPDGATVVAEWSAQGSNQEGAEMTLHGVLSITVDQGVITHVRDYMDVLGLAAQTGRASALLSSLDTR